MSLFLLFNKKSFQKEIDFLNENRNKQDVKAEVFALGCQTEPQTSDVLDYLNHTPSYIKWRIEAKMADSCYNSSAISKNMLHTLPYSLYLQDGEVSVIRFPGENDEQTVPSRMKTATLDCFHVPV